MKNETLLGEEDGLVMNEDVGSWSDFKYRLVQLYCQLFTAGMKGKWGSLVYVDLYSGSGQSRVSGTGEILLGSPLIALSIDVQFDKYIFCEQDTDKLDALRTRVGKRFPKANVEFVEGDCSDTKDEIYSHIPAGSLGLCFVDPYDLSLKFDTLRRLSDNRRMDFLCLIASHMDGSRNHAIYSGEKSTKLDLFLGSEAWREERKKPNVAHTNFGKFVASQFALSMETLGHLPTPLHKMKEIRTDDGNIPLYHLALFARHDTAHHYWKEVLKYSTPQKTLFD
jgi:three-Cys-motif partner protein